MRLAVLLHDAACGCRCASRGPRRERDADAADPSAATKRCPRGYVHASIAGRHRCLRVGQRCKRTWDRAYHRNGFHCHTGRLVRKRRPAPPPPPAGLHQLMTLGHLALPGCQPPSPAQAWGNGSCRSKKARRQQARCGVLLFQGVWARGGNATFTAAVGRPFKIVWRMTGRAVSPPRRNISERHNDRPGEWTRRNRARTGTVPATVGQRLPYLPSRAAGKYGASRDSSVADLWIALLS